MLANHAKIAAAKELTLPIAEDSATYYYEGYDYGLVVFPSEPQDQNTIDEFMGITPKALPKPASISLSVVDGGGSATIASTTASSLSSLGFHVVAAGSATPVGPISETKVVYSSDRPPRRRGARPAARCPVSPSSRRGDGGGCGRSPS